MQMQRAVDIPAAVIPKVLGLASMLVLMPCCLHDSQSSSQSAKDAHAVVATVAGMPLFVKDFQKQAKRIHLSLQADAASGDRAGGGDGSHGASDTVLPAVLSSQAYAGHVLGDGIQRRLLMHAAEKQHLRVGPNDVEAAYARLQQGWRPTDWIAALQTYDITPAELKDELHGLLLGQQYVRQYILARVAVTDAEIESYIQAHADLLDMPEQIRVQQIVLKDAQQAHALARDLKRPTSRRWAAPRSRAFFEEAASRYSISPEGHTGGDLGFFPRGVMPPAFDKACFKLKIGDISPVVESPYGFHLFKLIARRPARTRTAAEVWDAVEKQLRQSKERHALQTALQTLREEAPVVVWEKQLAQLTQTS